VWGSRFVKKHLKKNNKGPSWVVLTTWPYKAIICLQVAWKSIWSLYYFTNVVEIFALTCCADQVHLQHFS
jgi:hypothetical protein